jgi:hypothetical protein
MTGGAYNSLSTNVAAGPKSKQKYYYAVFSDMLEGK